jgi:hypothetical protein
MAETITIRTGAATDVIKVVEAGPQGPAGSGIGTLTTQGDTLYQGASEAQRLPIGTAGQILKVNSGGTAPEWGAAPASGVSSVNGQTGAVTVAAVSHTHQPNDIFCDAADVADTTLSGGEPNGIYFRDGSDNGKAIYKSAQGYAIYWDEGEEEWVLGNVPQSAKYFIGTGDTTYPWQATSWTLGPQGSGETPVVDQALLSNFQRDAAQDSVSTRTPKTGNASSTEVVLGSDTRLTNSRTPTAHAASHAAAGSDPVFNQDLNTDSLVTFDAVTCTDSLEISGETGILFSDPNAAFNTRTTLGAAASGSITSSGLTQSTARILGRTTASTGSIEEISIGSGLSLSAGELSSTVSAGIPATLLDAKGDLIVASAADTAARLAVGGTNGHVLTVDSSETLGVKWAAAAGGVGGGTGSTDNSILRSDGTGGSTLQASAIVIEDAVSPINITGDAGTDIITAVGHTYTANQGVRFPTLTGGAGLTAATTNYFVRDISGDTFKVSTTSGGSAVNFTTNITAGTVVAMQNSVALANAAPDTNSSLVLLNKGTGSFIVSPARPDGTATGGGNPRGDNAVCIAPSRSAATQVASGSNAVVVGALSSAGGTSSVALGHGASAGGNTSIAIGFGAGTVGSNFTVSIGRECGSNAAQSTVVGYASTANAVNSVALGTQLSAGLRGQLATSAFNAVYWGGQTTNATPLILNLDATATNRFTIAASTALAVDILLVARRSDVADKWLVARRFLGIRRDGSNNTSLIGSVQTLGTDQSAGSPTWTFALTADDTNDALQLEVTGAASETIQWRATAFYRVA